LILCLQNRDSGLSIRCDICQAVYDQECSGMQSDTFDTLLTIITESGWVCLNCKSRHLRTVDKLRAEVSSLSEVVAEMKLTMEQMSKNITNGQKPEATNQPTNLTTNQSVTDDSETNRVQNNPAPTEEVYRAVLEISNRRRNVVITGLPEIETEQSDDTSAKQLEEAAFTAFCEENLTVKPSLSHLGCRRLGKRHTSRTQPRRLLVHLSSEQNAHDLLSSARTVLRNHPDKQIATTVYINPDLTPTEAKEAYETERRTEKAKGTRSSADADNRLDAFSG